MTEILVVPHGGRWAVKRGPDATPIAEYETRDLAEAAARDMAAETRADVRVEGDADPHGGANTEPHVEDAPDAHDGVGARTGGAGGTETTREPQAGL